MHPDYRHAAICVVLEALLQRFDGLLGEKLIDRHVGSPVIGREDCAAYIKSLLSDLVTSNEMLTRHRVKQRPVRAVTASIIVHFEEIRITVYRHDLREEGRSLNQC